MIILRQDSRDLHYFEKFGQTAPSDFPLEFNVDTPIQDVIQSPGDIECTAITTCDVAGDEENTVYSYQDLFNRIPHTLEGASPRDALGEAVKGGLRRQDNGLVETKWSSYWKCDSSPTGLIDSFDAVRSALVQTNFPVACATMWYNNWANVNVLPVGQNVVSGHMYAIEGWKRINGEPMLIIEAWIGYKVLMPRETFNQAINGLGCGAWILSTVELDQKRKISILQKIVDAMVNLVLFLKQQLYLKKTITPPTVRPLEVSTMPQVKQSLLNEFCTAIRDYEGSPGDLSYRNNNPGNLRKTNGQFFVFDTYEQGFIALKDYVIRACTDRHKAYKSTFTFYQFFAVYAPSGDNNNPNLYTEHVCKQIGIEPTEQIKILVT